MAMLAALVFLPACDKVSESPSRAEPAITGNTITFATDHPQLANIATARVEAPRDRELQMPGRLAWDEDRTVRVFTPFSGRVTRLIANIGDRVAAGQPLAELQSPDFGQAQADARRAESDLNSRTAQLKRVQELASAGIAPAKDLQQAEADFQSATAEYQRATARIMRPGMTTAGVGAVDQRFVLKSPVSGMIVERNLNPGQELRPDQPGSPLFVVTDPTRLWVQLDANEVDLESLRVGTPLVVTSPHYPDDTFAGELKKVADFIDPATRTLKLRGAVPNPDRRLKAEMFVSARMAMPKNSYPTVPEKAVFLDGVRRFVFVRTESGAFVRRGVRTGPSYGDVLPVLAGLAAGDEVVVAGNLYLQQMLAAAGVKTAVTETGVSSKSPASAK
jgi:cobalt-zinc-cadmium efflux system membrane fusion protein